MRSAENHWMLLFMSLVTILATPLVSFAFEIHVRDGKTGAAIAGADVMIEYRDPNRSGFTGENFKTNKNGDIKVRFEDGVQIQFFSIDPHKLYLNHNAPNYGIYMDCWGIDEDYGEIIPVGRRFDSYDYFQRTPLKEPYHPHDVVYVFLYEVDSGHVSHAGLLRSNFDGDVLKLPLLAATPADVVLTWLLTGRASGRYYSREENIFEGWDYLDNDDDNDGVEDSLDYYQFNPEKN